MGCGAADAETAESRASPTEKGTRGARIPFVVDGLKDLFQVVRQMLVHLEHAEPVLAAKDLLQLGVSHDLSFVLRILQVVPADVIPDFRNDLAARQRAAAGDRREI